MRFWIDVPSAVSYGNLGAYLRGWLSGFNREPKRRNPYANFFRRGAWESGWLAAQEELRGDLTYRRFSRHVAAEEETPCKPSGMSQWLAESQPAADAADPHLGGGKE